MAPAGELSRPRGSLPRSVLRPSHGPCSWPRGQTRGAGAWGWPRPHLPAYTLLDRKLIPGFPEGDRDGQRRGPGGCRLAP